MLERAGRGEVVLTVAASGRTGHDPAELAVTARQEEGEGADWILDGVQTAVPWAHDADFVVVPAHTATGRTVLALVPRVHDGVALGEQFSTSGERLGELRLDSVRIAARDVIDVEGAWEWLRDLLTTGTCALALGLGERVLRMSSEYTSEREQFGFPIATFQAVAVQAADRYIDLRAMEVTLWQAAWRIASGARGALPVAGDVAVAKIWASEGVRRVVQTAQHLHGGFGADVDYPCTGTTPGPSIWSWRSVRRRHTRRRWGICWRRIPWADTEPPPASITELPARRPPGSRRPVAGSAGAGA